MIRILRHLTNKIYRVKKTAGKQEGFVLLDSLMMLFVLSILMISSLTAAGRLSKLSAKIKQQFEIFCDDEVKKTTTYNYRFTQQE